jgi:hypothetical protein
MPFCQLADSGSLLGLLEQLLRSQLGKFRHLVLGKEGAVGKREYGIYEIRTA